ncbi:MAG: acetylxylan esterase [Planctomycetes bacterium]|nr:acetylxylan esterase [Planctomycetota bacterium]
MRILALVIVLLGSLQDNPSRVLPEGKVPADSRLGPLKDYDGYFPFEVPATRAAWEARAAEIRLQVQVATGLWPLPERTPLKARIFGRVDRPDFTVDKVAFESFPGHFVTGLLFRPKGKTGLLPAVLSPHGHEGRLWDYGEKNVRKMIADGAERFEKSGRFPQLARCATLARLGCVSFIWDMLGYADSVQIPTAVAHRLSKQRPGLDTPERWGFFSTQAELRLQSILGVQAWNALRALDFLAGLPEVDKARIGVTGSSGGGTQTILVCALDPRPAAAFPMGMVSTSMQGGCTCENACGLRVGTGNVELTALFAPKPQGMTAANDWTKEMMTKGYPELGKLYAMLGAKDNVKCWQHVHFPHNYNYVSRALMYSWFNRHLKLGLEEPVVEEDFEPLTPAEYTVWDAEHPKPASGEDVEVAFLKAMSEASDRQIAALDAPQRRGVVAGFLQVLIGRRLPAPGTLTREKVDKKDCGDHWQFKDLLRAPARGEELPIVSFHPKQAKWNGKVVIWADGAGKAGMYGAGGAPRAELKKLVDAGYSVLGGDLLYQGEFLADGRPLKEQPKVKNTRECAAFTYGYTPPVFAGRVQDLLTLIAFVADDEHAPKEITLVGVNGAGPVAAAARAQAGKAITRTYLDTRGFRFAGLTSYRDPDFLQGAVKYGDLPAILSLGQPGTLWLAGEGAKVPEGVRAFPGSSAEALSAAVDALIAP